MGGGAWWAAICGVAKSRTRLSAWGGQSPGHTLQLRARVESGSGAGWGHCWEALHRDTPGLRALLSPHSVAMLRASGHNG